MTWVKILSKIYVFLLPVSLAAVGFAQDMPYRNMEKDILKAMADFHVPGMAIGIVKNGVPVYMKGFGVKRVDQKDPVDEHTVFGIGSASKTFNAGLAALLVMEGRMTWDDKVTQHIPDFRLYDPWVTKEVTIRDMLSHRIGVSEPDNLGLLFLGSRFSRDEVVAKSQFLPPLIGFRTGWFYCNIMFIVAGQCMAKITGKSWDDNIREKIFAPLGMSSSSTSIRDFKPGDNLATPHWYEDGRPIPIPWGNMDTAGPAGSINSSVSDLVKWVQLHLNGGTFSGKTLWSAEIEKQMLTPHSLLVGIPLGWKTAFSTYGLGWFISDYRGRAVAWHAGNCDGMSCVIAMVPEEKLGIVILQNTYPTQFEIILALRIIDAYTGVPEKDWDSFRKAELTSFALSKYKPEKNEKPVDAKSAQKYFGMYISELFGKAEVCASGTGMTIRFEAYPPAVLHPKAENVFVADFGDSVTGMFGLILGGRVFEEVKFAADDSGNIKEMTVERFGTFNKEN